MRTLRLMQSSVALHKVVAGGEIVLQVLEVDPGAGGDIAHRVVAEIGLAEQLERGSQNQANGRLALGSGRLPGRRRDPPRHAPTGTSSTILVRKCSMSCSCLSLGLATALDRNASGRRKSLHSAQHSYTIERNCSLPLDYIRQLTYKKYVKRRNNTLIWPNNTGRNPWRVLPRRFPSRMHSAVETTGGTHE